MSRAIDTMTTTALSPSWIAKQDLATLCDLAGIQPANLAIELGIDLASDDYSPMIDSLCQSLGIDPDTAEPHLDRWLEQLTNYFW